MRAKDKARLVSELNGAYALRHLLKAAQLARSTFYYQRHREGKTDRYTQLKQHIAQLFMQHKGRYGYRRITALLKYTAQALNHKTVLKLMRQLGIRSQLRRKKAKAYPTGAMGKSPNLLARQFNAQAPNEKWVTDLTQFKVSGQTQYLSAVMDLYNSEIIAWHLSAQPDFKLVARMLRVAAKRLGRTDHPLLHSDQGWHYQQLAYRRLLKQYGLIQSMSRKGNCLDNAAMENFFGILKSEFFYPQRFSSTEQFVQELRQYICYYNEVRIKGKLGWKSPVQFRLLAGGVV